MGSRKNLLGNYLQSGHTPGETSFRPNKFKNVSVKGHKIISLAVATAHVGLPLNVTFLRVVKCHAGYRFVATLRRGEICTFLFRVMNLGSIHLKQINYLPDGGRTFF